MNAIHRAANRAANKESTRMTKYLISFPSAAMVFPEEELQAVSDASHAVVQEAKDAGVWVFGGGIDETIPPVMVDGDGTVREGTYPQTTQLEGGYTVLELPSYDAALEWAAKIAAACRCAQEVRAFQYDPASVSEPTDIDVTFDFRSDTPEGRDPDAASPTLRRYHRLLWSKPLQNGAMFDLDASNPRRYLHHQSELGEFFLSSDSIIRTFRRHLGAARLMAQIPEAEQEAFSRQGYTIGGMMVFPGNRINGKQTINQRRGTHPRIADRFDLTLECIRLHYLREASPLSGTLALYPDFFDMFGDFRGYVDFFLLQDLVTDDYGAIQFFPPFTDEVPPFTDSSPSPIPTGLPEYEPYRKASLEFVAARNARIADFCA
jgi:hypothetical protein